MISSQRADLDLRRKSLVVPRKERIKIVEEILVVASSDEMKLQIRAGSSLGIINVQPKLLFSYPQSELSERSKSLEDFIHPFD